MSKSNLQLALAWVLLTACGGEVNSSSNGLDVTESPSGSTSEAENQPGPSGSAPVASNATPIAAPTLSQTCSVAPFAPAAWGMQLPTAVRAAHELRCQGLGYGPWLAGTGQGRATVMFVTNAGTFSTHLFNLHPGAVEALDLASPDSATNVLTRDGSGSVAVFVGEKPGIELLRHDPAGWTAEPVVGGETERAILADAHVAKDAQYAVYYQLADGRPRLAQRSQPAQDWQVSVLSEDTVSALDLDVDAAGKPWVAWLADRQQRLRLEMFTPDARTLEIWSSPSSSRTYFWRPPIVLSGGLSGRDAYPTLALQHEDGIHVLAPDLTGQAWADHLVEDSALSTRKSDCPTTPSPTPEGCGGKTVCSSQAIGAHPGLGFVRVRDGEAYLAWVQSTSKLEYRLSEVAPEFGAPGLKQCRAELTAQDGSTELMIARVGLDGAMGPQPTLRMKFQLNGPMTELSRNLTMTSYGDSLLIAASLTTSADSKLVYLEVDTRALAQ